MVLKKKYNSVGLFLDNAVNDFRETVLLIIKSEWEKLIACHIYLPAYLSYDHPLSLSLLKLEKGLVVFLTQCFSFLFV